MRGTWEGAAMGRLFPSRRATPGPGACRPGATVPERPTLSLRGKRCRLYDAALVGGVRAATLPDPGGAGVNDMTFFLASLQTVLGLWIALAIPSVAAQARAPSWLTAGGTPTAVVRTEQVQAELLVHAPQGLSPGQPMWLGLQLTHQKEWHTYWKNPGDSGLPTELRWTLPPGAQAGDIAWPAPRKFPLGNLANYGYEGTVLLPVPMTLPAGFEAAELDIRLKASWLVCRRECIPQEGDFALQVPTRGSLASHGAAFEAALAAQPRNLPDQGSKLEVAGQTLRVRLQGLPSEARGQRLEFFPETAGIIEPAGAWTQAWQGATWKPSPSASVRSWKSLTSCTGSARPNT